MEVVVLQNQTYTWIAKYDVRSLYKQYVNVHLLETPE